MVRSVWFLRFVIQWLLKHIVSLKCEWCSYSIEAFIVIHLLVQWIVWAFHILQLKFHVWSWLCLWFPRLMTLIHCCQYRISLFDLRLHLVSIVRPLKLITLSKLHPRPMGFPPSRLKWHLNDCRTHKSKFIYSGTIHFKHLRSTKNVCWAQFHNCHTELDHPGEFKPPLPLKYQISLKQHWCPLHLIN